MSATSSGAQLKSLLRRWCIQLADALNYLHSRSPTIIHRDLNVNNLVLTAVKPSQVDVKLIDFGLHTVVARPSSPSEGQWLPAG